MRTLRLIATLLVIFGSAAAAGAGGNRQEPKVKDRAYWQKQPALIDKRYAVWITPLRAERFQLVHRRAPAKGESLAAGDNLGLGLPPRVTDIDIQNRGVEAKAGAREARTHRTSSPVRSLAGVVLILQTPPAGRAQSREAMAKTKEPLRPMLQAAFSETAPEP